MIIKVIIFKHEHNGNWESGLCIESKGTANDYIIDSEGNIIIPNKHEPALYSIKDKPCYYCIDIEPLLSNLNKLISIGSIDEIVRLSKVRSSVLFRTGTNCRRLPASVIVRMTIHTVLKFIDNKQLFY